MTQGLTIFAAGLFAATLERARAQGVSIEEAFRIEVEELNAFIKALEEKYQEAKRSGITSQAAVMEDVADWVERHDR